MKTETVNISYQNINHLYNKMNELKVEILKSTKTIHLLGISETHLDDYERKIIKRNKKEINKRPVDDRMDNTHIEIQNYKLIKRKVQSQLDTGIVVYIHSSISKHIKRRHDLETNNIECIWLEFKQNKSTPLLVCFLYRNPDDTFGPWLERYESMIDNVLNNDCEINIQGDFNIDLRKPQTTWNNLTLAFGFSQLINETTRITSDTLIDHIYTNNRVNITSVDVIKTSLSDHYMISCSFATKIKLDEEKGHTSVQYRCYKTFNDIAFQAELNNLPFSSVYHTTDLDIAKKTFIDLFTHTVNKHIPLKTRRVKHPNLPKFLTADIIQKMKVRDNIKQNKNKKQMS